MILSILRQIVLDCSTSHNSLSSDCYISSTNSCTECNSSAKPVLVSFKSSSTNQIDLLYIENSSSNIYFTEGEKNSYLFANAVIGNNNNNIFLKQQLFQ